MKFLNSIYYKSLVALYKLNTNKDGRAKSIIIDAIFEALVIGKDGLNSAIMQMALETATDDWLDFWGNFLGIYRMYDEEDNEYRLRIIEEIIAPKSTIPALKKATARFLKNNHKINVGEDSITIFEPWTELLKFDDRGVLDGNGRMISYDYWNYAVIDISIPDSSLITPQLIDYLNKVKAGGVKIFFSIAPNWGIVIDPEWEEKRHKVWQKIYRQTLMMAKEHSDGFILMRDGDLSKLKENDRGGTLDSYGVLEGRQKVYWNGIGLMRSLYITGPIRNHINSAVQSLEDYKTISDNENLTIEDASKLEDESFNGTRLNEGKLTISQNHISHNKEHSYEFYYLRNNETISFTNTLSVLKWLDISCINKLKEMDSNLIVIEFIEILNNPNYKPLLTKIVRSFLIQKMKDNVSVQGPLIIKKEKIDEHSNI